MMVGVVTHLSRKVKGHAETRLALLQQVAVAAVGLSGGAKSSVLAHSPESSTVARRMDSAGKGVLSRHSDIGHVVLIRYVERRVSSFDGGP